jgi:hypothetical protein
MFNNLVYDIAYRHPRYILVLANGRYFSCFGTDRFLVSEKTIEELLEKNFVTKNKYGGMEITNLAVEFAETLVQHKTKPNEHRHGGVISYAEIPELFKGE